MACRYSLFIALFLCAINVAYAQEVCDNIDCSKVKCLQRYDPFKCPEGSKYSAKGALCGCCPACVYYKRQGEKCLGDMGESSGMDLTRYFTPKGTFPMERAPVIRSQKCAPGLECKDNKCEYRTTDKCSGNDQNLQCDIDGTFAAVQCKENGPLPRCFCYPKDSKLRIFGWDLYENGHKMACQCSRLVHGLTKLGPNNPHSDLVFHCSQNGNFEPMQCNNGLCACVDEMTGQPLTSFVHESLWKNLPCYNNELGGQFVRICDSQSIAARDMKKELSQHGSQTMLRTPPCDPDGSYASKQCENSASSCFCRTKANANIGAYFVEKGTVAESEMTCNCARDKVLFNKLSIPFPFDCQQNGNYVDEQKFDNGAPPCRLDDDGFYLSDCDGVRKRKP